MDRRVDSPVLDRATGGNRPEKIAVLPVARRPDRPADETTPTIRADVAEDGFHARRAKGAFEAADPRVDGFGRQRAIAVLARRSQRQGKDRVHFLRCQ